MKLPKELTIATPLSKYLAMLVFLALPIVGFFLGMRYQEMVDLNKRQEMEENLSIPRTPTPTPLAIPTIDPSISANWKTYRNTKYGFSFKYPEDWDFNQINKPEDDPDLRPVGVGRLSTFGYPYSRFYKLEDQKSQLKVSIINENFESLEKSLKLTPTPGVNGRKTLKYATGIYILLDSSTNRVLWIYGEQYPNKYFDQILSTFKFTKDNQDQVVCAQDVRLCPDGKTYVGRQPPDCEFASCLK